MKENKGEREMKQAKIKCSAFYVYCPYCQELVENLFTDSGMWELVNKEYWESIKNDKSYYCENCGHHFQLPKNILKIKI